MPDQPRHRQAAGRGVGLHRHHRPVQGGRAQERVLRRRLGRWRRHRTTGCCSGHRATRSRTAQRMIFYSFDRHGHRQRPVPADHLRPDQSGHRRTDPERTGRRPTTRSATVRRQHSDPDHDPMAAREIVVWPKGVISSGTHTWALPANLQSAGSDETASGRLLGSAFTRGRVAEVADRLRVGGAGPKTRLGVWGPYSARRALRITSSAPAVVATNVGTVDRLAEQTFGGDVQRPRGQPAVDVPPPDAGAVSGHTDVDFADPARCLGHRARHWRRPMRSRPG